MSSELVVAISNAIADVEDVKPTEFDYTLQEFIPGDAIRTLETGAKTPWRLRFELPEHMVTVTSDGLVFVDGIQTTSSRESHQLPGRV